MRRREFLGVLSGAAVAWPLAAWAQQSKMQIVGVLNPGLPDANANRLRAFQQGLRSAGFVEGENVSIEYRWAENQFDQLPALAADLVRQRVAVIFARSPPAARAAIQATTNIPIVFSMGEDPVKEGFVPSLNRPGGNVTGFSDFNNQLAGKKLGLMRDAVPKAAVFGLLVNPNQPNAGPDTKDMQVAAEARQQELRVLTASTERDLDAAFASMVQLGVGALLVNIDFFFAQRRMQIVALAARYAIPTLYVQRDFVDAGGLMSYGTDVSESFRQAGIYCSRILKGAKPADLPVVRATKFELVINMKTAKVLGLEIPPGVLSIVDEVIE